MYSTLQYSDFRDMMYHSPLNFTISSVSVLQNTTEHMFTYAYIAVHCPKVREHIYTDQYRIYFVYVTIDCGLKYETTLWATLGSLHD